MTESKRPPFPREITGDDVDRLISDKPSDATIEKLKRGINEAKEKVGWAKTMQAIDPDDPSYVVAETSAEDTTKTIDDALPAIEISAAQSKRASKPRRRARTLKQRGFDCVIEKWPGITADELLDRIDVDGLECDVHDIRVETLEADSIVVTDLTKHLLDSMYDYETSEPISRSAFQVSLDRARKRFENT